MSRVLGCLALSTFVACSQEPAPPPDGAGPAPTTATARPAPLVETRKPPARSSLLKALPRSTLLTLQLPDIGRAWDDLAKTVYGPWVQGMRFDELVQEFKPRYQALVADRHGSSGPKLPPWQDVESVIQSLNGEVLLALLDVAGLDGPTPAVRALGGCNVAGATLPASKLVQAVVRLAEESTGCRVQRNNKVWQLQWSGSPLVFEVGVDLDALLFGIGEDVVSDAMHRMRGPTTAFDMVGSGGFFKASDIARIHCNITAIVGLLGNLWGDQIQGALESLRLDRIRAFSAAVRIEDRKFVTETFLDSPGGFDLLTRMAAAHPVDYSILDRLRPGLPSFTLFSFHPAWLLRNILTGLPPLQASRLKASLQDLRRFGFTVDERTLGAVGPQWAQILLRPDDATSPGPATAFAPILNSAWIGQLRSPDEVHNLLDRLGEYIPTRRRYRIGSAEAISFDLGMMNATRLDLSPSFALTREHVYFALTREALRRSLEQGTERSSLDYRSALAGIPESVTSVTYDTLEGVNMVATALHSALAETPANDSPSLHKLRLLRAAIGNLDLATSYTQATDGGIRSRTTSATGGLSGIGGLTGFGVLAGMIIPQVVEARTNANESAAIAMLANIRTAQEEFRSRRLKDANGDEEGEYGFLAELMKPTGSAPLLRHCPSANGRYLRNGYIFRVFLPSPTGSPVGETDGASEQVDANLAERFMLAMAWPVKRGETGRRSFILNTSGEIFYCTDGDYGGRHAPPPDLLNFERGNMMSPTLHHGVLARDGVHWYRVR